MKSPAAGLRVPERAAPPPIAALPSLGRRALHGTLLSLANVGGVQLLRLAGNLILTRILFPEAYGLMAMILVLSQGLQMISDVGILPNIIQHERGEEREFLDTAWTIQLVRGVLITLVTAAIAWPYASFYRAPELVPLVLVASLQGLITGLFSTKLATLNRRMEVGKLVFVNLTAQLVTLGAMIAWAQLDRSVWALLGGALLGDVAKLLLSHFALPGRLDRPRWDRDAAAAIFGFGKWIFLSTLVTYAGMRFDVLALGRLEDMGRLGVYNIGQSLAGLPILVTGQIVIWVLLPGLSESFRGDRQAFGDNVRRARRVLNAAGVLMIGATAIGAPAFFYLLYDARYHDAGWMVQLSMLPAWFFFLSETSIRVQLAMGDARTQMFANVARLSGTVPGALLGFHWAGLPGLIGGLAIGSLACYLMVARSLARQGIPILATDAKWTAMGIGLAVLGGGLPWIIGPVFGADPELASIPIGALVLAPYAAWSGRLVLREIRAQRECA